MTRSKHLRISEPAKADLTLISDYTARKWGFAQKRKYLGQIRTTFKALTQSPGLGIPRDNIYKNLRSHPVGRHIIFYRETSTRLEIVRILHQSMDIEPLLVAR